MVISNKKSELKESSGIKEITEQNLMMIDSFLEKHFSTQEIVGRMKQFFLRDLPVNKIRILINSDDPELINTIAILNLEEGYILCYQLDEVEYCYNPSLQGILSIALEILQDYSFMNIRLMWKSEKGLDKSLISSLGFIEYGRAKMTLLKDDFDVKSSPESNLDLKFKNWDNRMKKQFIPILSDSHFTPNHPDAHIFYYCTGLEGCNTYLEETEGGKFGQFLPNHSYGCYLENRLVGACLFLHRQEQGYISEIAIATKFKGQKLGRILAAYSIKKWFENNPDSERIDLDVTITNPTAYCLYKSLGFKDAERYSIYCWEKPNFYVSPELDRIFQNFR